MGVSKNRGTPKWMVKIMEHPIKMDDLGGKPTIFENVHVGVMVISGFSMLPLRWERWRHNDFPLDQVAVSYSEATGCELLLEGRMGSQLRIRVVR